uniref:DUF38 domain-containing protein n=1 Tax=Panagrolaimus sp. PS1159 TaxID=55785 RepID=A0AC35EWJ7_9BILA
MDNMNNLQLALASFTTSSEPSSQIYTFKHPYPQHFSVPLDVIKYMIKNCKSGKAWKKLIMSCKYFYSKKPVFPVGHFDVVCDLKCKADGEMFDSSLTFPKLLLYDSFVSYEASIHDDPTTVASLIPKILQLDECTIKNDDGITVTVDKLLEGLQRLENCDICINGSSFHSDAVGKMVEHLNGFTKMRCLKFEGLTETFSISDFAGFLMSNEVVEVELAFRWTVSNGYRKIVQNVIKKIKKNRLLKVPIVYFY